MRIDLARRDTAPASDHAMRKVARARLGRSCLMMLVGLALSLAGPAGANPLTETPNAPSVSPPAEAEAPRTRDEAAERAEAETVNPSATAIIRSLAPFADGNPNAPARPLAVAPGDGGPALRVDTARSVDLTVFFAYDSWRLTREARIQLEPLGQALQSRALAGAGFLIAGHTDAAGDRLYNRRLSLARARAVRAHLVEAYGIAPERLRIHGWGASRLKDADAPLSRVNRRVEVSVIAPRTSALSPYPVAEADCAGRPPRDPRPHAGLDLDDFDAAPTPIPCAD